MNPCSLEDFFGRERGNYRAKSFGEHRLPCSRRAVHCNVVSASRRDLQSAFGRLLPFYKREVCVVRFPIEGDPRLRLRLRFPALPPYEVPNHLVERLYCKNFYTFYEPS